MMKVKMRKLKLQKIKTVLTKEIKPFEKRFLVDDINLITSEKDHIREEQWRAETNGSIKEPRDRKSLPWELRTC